MLRQSAGGLLPGPGEQGCGTVYRDQRRDITVASAETSVLGGHRLAFSSQRFLSGAGSGYCACPVREETVPAGIREGLPVVPGVRCFFQGQGGQTGEESAERTLYLDAVQATFKAGEYRLPGQPGRTRFHPIPGDISVLCERYY